MGQGLYYTALAGAGVVLGVASSIIAYAVINKLGVEVVKWKKIVTAMMYALSFPFMYTFIYYSLIRQYNISEQRTAVCSIIACLIFTVLVVMALVDKHTKLSLNIMSTTVTILCIIYAIVSKSFTLSGNLAGIGLFTVLLIIVSYIYRNKDTIALGEGDFYILIAMSVVLDWKYIIFAIFIAADTALIVLIPALLKGNIRKMEVPFIPYLTIGLYVMFTVGDRLLAIITNGVI